jgi:LmbE family N-acetylglucosaminyl deacetylase
MKKSLALSAMAMALFVWTADHGISATVQQATPLRIIAFGAHPDDAELKAAGVAAKWAALGHQVKFVSATNGDIGHWREAGGPLAQRRTAEVQAAAKVLGITTEVLDIHDGEIEPTLENRRTFSRLIREWRADIVLGPRPNDYHPDHRATGQLLQDSAFMVTVPFFVPDTEPLRRNPVFLSYSDRFTRPNPFRADIVIGIDDVIEKKVDALALLESQFYEGGAGPAQDLPTDPAAIEQRKQQVRQRFFNSAMGTANQFRDKLIELYGPTAGAAIRYAEAFEISEYGRQPSGQEIRTLFPFLPAERR